MLVVAGYLTFSGEHTNYGNTVSMPNPDAPNDMIAAYWSDLDLTNGGQIFTQYFDGPTMQAVDDADQSVRNFGSCKYGIADGAACCALTCGSCGGAGCGTRPGGAANCCYGPIAGATPAAGVPLCRDNNGRGPCKIDESFFVIEWKDVPFCCGAAGAAKGTVTFEVVLYENGAMRFQYQNVRVHKQAFLDQSSAGKLF